MNIPLSISVSFFLSAIFAAIVSKLGYRIVLLDNPNVRSSHSHPTPRGGGIGIWIVFILIGVFGFKDVLFTVIGGAVGLLGLVEDRFALSSKSRLIIQFGLSTAVVYLFSGTPASVVAMVIFLFWTVFITGTANFYNFMDGINGIAGLTGVVGFGLMAFFSFYIANRPDVAFLSVVLAMACLGFLPFNFPKARVFMGDVGSVLLGFLFASFVVKLSTDIALFLCLVMFLCTFYADATVTIFYRWRRGENLMEAHRSHLYQYMSNELGLPHWKVSLLYVFVQLAVGVIAMWAYQNSVALQIIMAVVYGISFIFSYKFIKAIRPKRLKQQVVRI